MSDTQNTSAERPVENPCRICERRPYEQEHVCNACRIRVPFRLRDLEELYAELVSEEETYLDDRYRTEYLGRPGDVSQRLVWHSGGEDGERGAWKQGPSTLGQSRDPVAAGLPVPPMKSRSKAPSVSGTREASTPLDLARAGLLAPAIRVGGRPAISTPGYDVGTRYDMGGRRDPVRNPVKWDLYQRSHLVPKVVTTFEDRLVFSWVFPAPPVVEDGQPMPPLPAPEWKLVTQRLPVRSVVRDDRGNPVMVPTGDQVGHPSIAQVLDGWARDIHALRVHRYGERRPMPEVSILIRWLGDRWDWICDEYEAVGDYAWAVTDLCGIIRSVLGHTDPLPEPRLGVICRSCDTVSAIYQQHGDPYLECQECGELYNAEEWTYWTRMLVAAEKERRPAAEIRLLQSGRCPGCRHYLHPVPDWANGKKGCRDSSCWCDWTGYLADEDEEEELAPEPAGTTVAQQPGQAAAAGPCSCPCHIGGAYRPACTVVGGCGSIGCDGNGWIKARGGAAAA